MYDGADRLVRVTNAQGVSTSYTYDEVGNMTSVTDRNGNVTSYTYDSLDRLSSKQNNDGTVNYTYTADGKISAVTDSTGTTTFTYDLMDGLTRVDYPDVNYVAYSYDNACRLAKLKRLSARLRMSITQTETTLPKD